ncbi:penicillin-binding protein 1C [Polaribacter reichenbachii]|uniref:peptidoglycan glycosyltransferase n=1 Tax=Polaribacter reichenbachii TaxID=996801 RepID=A0A1B8TVG6_9FLAO|nr:penicillin-binding protein 1C [Polaribacter reichenbachii]APZ45395.1 penicillin-binding protein 1C [Polaribacter reichenbachii]AUC19256.1 penicillin-binding protein 1C [Polaribacter reichenbachii]OBY63588.1 penicillin-binding protein 1C [Polaribacter reichenbachii]
MKITDYIKRHKKKTIVLVVLLIFYAFCLPKDLFTKPTSTVITSYKGELLGALIADDGQWRFPHNDSVPEKFKTCLIQFEDEYFYKHPGFNPISIFKAFRQNLKAGKVKRGGSTITQQVIRLSRNNRDRTYFEKLKELVLATRLEFRASKEKIIAFWASNAPYGGNVVGLDAASWRYFNRKPSELSWSETATLAVLPNAPNLIYPGKNQDKLLAKRNRLLKKLLTKKVIDSLTYELSILEGLPQKAYAIPQIAPHLLQKINKEKKGEFVKTTINKKLQTQTNTIVKNHYNQLSKNGIYNISVLVLDVKTRQVLSYVGNAPTDNKHQKNVDVIDKPRSTGSILKPFLYAAMLDNGELLPNTLVADIPTNFGSYQPENFDKKYAGAISAKLALSRSLNVPTVRMLQSFGLEKFHHYLQKLQLKDIKKSAEYYGLTLALGGAESNLWDLCKSYAAMASTVNHYSENSSRYFTNEFSSPTLYADKSIDFGAKTSEKIIFDAASIYLTLESLKDVNRPNAEENWEFFDSSKQIAWKTGTSFGFRDAWAIGTTKDYVVGVWVGNADGEGRPGLVGVQTAGPILFDVFDKLPNSTWFEKPFDEMTKIEICNKSGYRATDICEEKTLEFVQNAGLKTKPCPYHISVNVDESETYQVNTSCENLENIKQKSWFVLPPLLEYYYKKQNPFYKPLPKFRNDCLGDVKNTMKFIYPTEKSTIFLPKNFNGKQNELVLKVAHSNNDAILYWYANNTFLGTTKELHSFAIQPKVGEYNFTVMDNFGNEIHQNISVKH